MEDEKKTPTVEELQAQVQALTESNAALTASLEKQKAATDNASSDAAGWKKKFRDTQSEAERKEAESAEELQALREKVAAQEKASTIATYKASYLGMGYSDDLAGRKAQLMADGKYTEAIAVESEFLAEQKKKMEAESLNHQPGLTSGKPPEVTNYDSMTDAEYYAATRKK